MLALVVDDSAAMRRIQERALVKLGWQVRTADSGRAALAQLADWPECELLLTDWHMPEMDGLELVRAVRRSGKNPRLRIVVVTSDAVLDSVQLALDAGADDFLMKPFSNEALVERVQAVMGG